MTKKSLIEWLEAMKSEMTTEGQHNTTMVIQAIEREGITN